MKNIHTTLVATLVLVLGFCPAQADDRRRLTGGNQNQVNRQVLRLTPGIAKDPNRYVDRTVAGVIEELGGTDKTENAVRRALDWLVKQQQDDGHWEETTSPIAHTGLAMLCFYGYGASHIGEKEPILVNPGIAPDKGAETTAPPTNGAYQKALAKAVEWMVKKVGPDGRLMDGGRMYDHTIGTLALAEAYGASGDEKLKEPLEKAVKFLIRAQNPKTGGWRYAPYHIKQDAGDLSVSGWAIMALASAQLSGVVVPKEPRAKALAFLDSVGTGAKLGMFGYNKPQPTPSMTAVGMYSHELLVGPDICPRLDESVRYLMTHLPNEKQADYYYWYYGTLCMRLYGAEGVQQEAWEEWNSRMSPLLLELQSSEGSWDAIGKRGKREGKIVTTAWATLSLQVYYRYTPLSKINPAARRLRGGASFSVQPNPGAQPTRPFSLQSTRPNSGRPR